MKHLFQVKLLVTLFVIFLCIPTTVFGQESDTVEHHVKLNGKLNALSGDLLRFTTSTQLEQNNLARKGPIVDKDKHQDRFEQKARHYIRDLEAGKYQHALKSTSRALKKSISEQWLEEYWVTLKQQLQSQAGEFLSIGSVTVKESNRVHTNVEVELLFEKATFPFILRMDRSAKVDDFLLDSFMGPFAEAPLYSKPELFTEKEVVIGKGDFALPGTLSIPKGKGPFPAVVLVQGSGATDKDETVYALKPFRDLAFGLASQGIAVLRYNKRTYEHAIKTTADPNHTVDKETTDDALLATRLLEKEKRIDEERIYILGHSQGGMMVPKMIEEDKRQNIAGAIIMGGPARTIQDVVLDQFEYLLSVGQITEQVYEFYTTQYEMLNDPDFSGENPPEEFQLGQAAFWDSINDIRAAEMAKNQTEPLLIIQGERDYQVLSDVEIPVWKAALRDRENITYQLYPKLNHFFTEGTGEMSKPEEYFIPANIPKYVVNDIVDWVKSEPQ